MNPEKEPDYPVELGRIRSSSWLAVVLLLLSAFLDGPVTILGWMLFGSGVALLLYVAAASTLHLKSHRSHNH